MNEETDRFDPSRSPAAIKKLAEHLAALNAQAGEESTMENDMLSLIVSGTLNGENIDRRYPAFHQKLLENPALRQAFLDALESIEAERAGGLIPMPGAMQTQLSFLSGKPETPLIEFFDKQKWRATWGRTLEQLQAIFAPPEMAYRANPSLTEDPWYTLLREAIKAEGITYDVVLDCSLSTENEDSLSTFLNLAITLGNTTGRTGLPLRANLTWGDYQASVLIPEEGRVRFPDVPIDSVFDKADAQPKAGFHLSLETAS